MNPREAATTLIGATQYACNEINEFSRQVFRTRGGRIGSGMGTLLEGLWGYYVNTVLQGKGDEAAQCEIAWLADHEYNDFACIERDKEWIPQSKKGELLRVEAKSMNIGADESKAHFDEIIEHLGEWDLLLVLVWSWVPADDTIRIYPQIQDYFIGSARSVAKVRDHLHIARGGSFVNRSFCPDGCSPELCTHHGEPLNAAGSRERLTGPKIRKPANTSHASNFGGLVRMMKTRSRAAQSTLLEACKADSIANAYTSFIKRNYSRIQEAETKQEGSLQQHTLFEEK